MTQYLADEQAQALKVRKIRRHHSLLFSVLMVVFLFDLHVQLHHQQNPEYYHHLLRIQLRVGLD